MHPCTDMDVPIEVDVGPNVSTPAQQHLGIPKSMHMTNILVTKTITPPIVDVNEPFGQCMLEHAQNARNKHTIIEVQARFPGSSHVTRMRKLPISFLVNEEFIPTKIEKLPGI